MQKFTPVETGMSCIYSHNIHWFNLIHHGNNSIIQSPQGFLQSSGSVAVNSHKACQCSCAIKAIRHSRAAVAHSNYPGSQSLSGFSYPGSLASRPGFFRRMNPVPDFRTGTRILIPDPGLIPGLQNLQSLQSLQITIRTGKV